MHNGMFCNAFTYIFAEAVLLQQALHESALHGREQVLRVKAAEAGPVGEERFCLVPNGGGSVGELQQRQVRLLHPLENSDVLPLGAQHPAPEQVQLTAAATRSPQQQEEEESKSYPLSISQVIK